MRKPLLAAFAAVLLVATGYLLAQTTTANLPSQPITVVKPPKNIVKVNDKLALKVTGMHQGRVVGTLVANVDGQWVEVQLAPQDQLVGR